MVTNFCGWVVGRARALSRVEGEKGSAGFGTVASKFCVLTSTESRPNP